MDIEKYEIQNDVVFINNSFTCLIDIYSFIANSFRMLGSLLCQEEKRTFSLIKLLVREQKNYL